MSNIAHAKGPSTGQDDSTSPTSNGKLNETDLETTSSKPDTRDTMKKFWLQHEPSPNSMMLCSAANGILAVEDRAQVLKISPSLQNKRVLELSSGIGRFTTDLAMLAEKVTAVDFIESYVEKNREVNGHYNHVNFVAADVMDLDLPDNSYDVIFTNWLLMYLSDEEVEQLTIKMLGWLTDGGYLFIRESCYRPSGNIHNTTNPTYYRSPIDYFKLLQNKIYTSKRGKPFSFVCERTLSIEAYIKHYGNPFQLGFVLKKMAKDADSYDSFQAFLDGQQYTEEGIRKYEFIFGKTYVSTGGETTTEEFCQKLALTAKDKVLDVGCGIGGSAFHLAREYGSRVHGVDLSSNMISMALKYQSEMEESVRKLVSFEMSDITKQAFDPNSFDVIYSRDTILHIVDKESLFSKFFEWLKPGGSLMITDYCRGDKEDFSEDFLKYVHQRGYHLLSVPEYGQLLEKIGFENVVADDRTSQFIEILHKESKDFVQRKQEFLESFEEVDFNYILDGWSSKVERCSAGDQAWGFFKAVKPL